MKISLIKKEFSTKRVVVTGMGMVAPLGNNCKENWESLVNLKSGIKSLENEDFSNDLPKNCKIGAPICKNFDSKKFRTLGTDNLLTQITMSAAEEAIRDSNLTFNNKIIKYRTGVNVGSSLPSINCINESLKKVYENDYTHINRMLMLRMLTNLLASNISIKYDLRGPVHSPTMACATGLNAIGESYKSILYNEADVMICGGSENSIHPLVFHSMNKLNTLFSSNKNFSPEKSSRPFDVDRSGFIIGEGSGILVLERLDHALKREAKIYCEVVGYGTFGDAFHITKPTFTGEGGFRAMSKAIIDADISPYEIGFINTHSTSTEIGDISELNAIKNLFGKKKFINKNYFKNFVQNYEFDFGNYREMKFVDKDHLNKGNEFHTNDNELDFEKLNSLLINCNKTQIGHLLGAAGSVESIFAILAMKNNTIIDNINTDNPISNLLKFKYNKSLINENAFNYVLKNSFAFGGVNTSILYKKYI